VSFAHAHFHLRHTIQSLANLAAFDLHTINYSILDRYRLGYLKAKRPREKLVLVGRNVCLVRHPDLDASANSLVCQQ
jgi:hypothetical protein